MYDIKRIDIATKCVYTNTIPTAPYRGAGRPEAKLCARAAWSTKRRASSGIDPVKLRRRNLIKKSQMPYKTAVGTTFDSGDFEPILDKALELADYDDFKKRSARRPSAANIAGSASAACSNMPAARRSKARCSSFPGDDKLAVDAQRAEHRPGPRHGVSARDRRPARHSVRKIPHSNGDSANELPGYASVGSRSAMTVGHSLVKAIDTILQKGKPIAATMLEAGEGDIAYKDGHFEVVGTDRRITLFEVAARAAEMKKRGEIAEDLDTKIKDRDAADVSQRLSTSPKSRSIPTPAAAPSWLMRRSTIADARSITPLSRASSTAP